MKPGIHPDDRPVVVKDTATGDAFLTRSTATTATGARRIVDSAGRAGTFHRRYGHRR